MKKLFTIIFLSLIYYTSSLDSLKAEIIHLECLIVKESEPFFTKPNSPKLYEFISIDPEKSYAVTTATVFDGKVEKSTYVHPETKLEGKYFTWGKSWLSQNTTFYHYYKIDLKMLEKKGKSITRYVSNFTIDITDGVKERYNELECKKLKNANG